MDQTHSTVLVLARVIVPVRFYMPYSVAGSSFKYPPSSAYDFGANRNHFRGISVSSLVSISIHLDRSRGKSEIPRRVFSSARSATWFWISHITSCRWDNCLDSGKAALVRLDGIEPVVTRLRSSIPLLAGGIFVHEARTGIGTNSSRNTLKVLRNRRQPVPQFIEMSKCRNCDLGTAGSLACHLPYRKTATNPSGISAPVAALYRGAARRSKMPADTQRPGTTASNPQSGKAGESRNGARCRVRTCDPLRVKQMLYH